jgi:CRISPR-associated protein Cas2
MLYGVVYDITQDRRGNKIFKTMKKFGVAKQRSYFECSLDDKELGKMVEVLKTLIDPETDRLKVLPLHENIYEKAVSLGIGDDFFEEEDVIII